MPMSRLPSWLSIYLARIGRGYIRRASFVSEGFSSPDGSFLCGCSSLGFCLGYPIPLLGGFVSIFVSCPDPSIARRKVEGAAGVRCTGDGRAPRLPAPGRGRGLRRSSMRGIFVNDIAHERLAQSIGFYFQDVVVSFCLV